MTNPIIIIHGWSDTSDSFTGLKADIEKRTQRPTQELFLADWISLDDSVSISDVAEAMDRAWTEHKLPRTRRSVDVVVHSTGALVVREWIRRQGFTRRTNPIYRFGMLAPANFGSPLAHKGRSLVGRVAKGWNNWFETGTLVLKGLEMASPYSWDLAEADLLQKGQSLWGVGGMLATVLVGDTGYRGLRALVNEDGSDGTVYVSTARLPCDKVTLDYRSSQSPKMSLQKSKADVAFGIMSGLTHASVCSDQNAMTWLAKAMDVSDKTFPAHAKDLETNQSQADGRYQNTVIRLRDDHGADIKDYLIEFTLDTDQEGKSFVAFQKQVLTSVHAYSDNAAYRSLMMDCDKFDSWKNAATSEIHISLTAHPIFILSADKKSANRRVGYRTLTAKDIGDIRIPLSALANVVSPHRTLLVDIIIRREQGPDVFTIKV
jgi:hypothetical protein